MTNAIGTNPQLQQFESMSYNRLVPTANQVFSDKEQEKMLSVLQRALDNDKDRVSKESFDKLQKTIDELVAQSSRNDLNESALVKVVDNFTRSGVSQMGEITNYLKIKKQFDLATLVRNSHNEAAKNSGDVDLSLRLDSGDLGEASDSQQKLLKNSSTKSNVLRNNLRMLSDQDSPDKEALVKLYSSLDHNTESFDDLSEQLHKFLVNNQDISEDTKDTLKTVQKTLKENDTNSVYDKIKHENSEDLLNQNFKELEAKLAGIKSEGSIIGKLKSAKTAEDAGHDTVEHLIKQIGGKVGVTKFLTKYGKFGKVLGTAAAIGTAGYEGFNELNDTEAQYKAGKINKDQEIRKNSGTVGATTGKVGGAILGMEAGATAGAAIGSVVPIVGTAIGGAVGGIAGGALGYWGGGKGGRWLGDKAGVGVNYARKLWSKESKALNDEHKKFIKATDTVIWGAMHPVVDAVDHLHHSMSGYAKQQQEMTKTLGDYTDATKEATQTLTDGIGKAAQGIWGSVKTAVSSTIDSVKNGYNKGGVGGALSAGASAIGQGASNIWKSVTSGASDIKTAAGLAAGQLGSVSHKYESGRSGVGTISSGAGDHGGVSYGTYQLASNNGSMASFLNSAEAKQHGISSQFNGLAPGSAAFNAKYKQLTSDPKGAQAMQDAQQAYAKRQYYDSAVAMIKKATGLDINSRSRAIQEALWSTSVQYGPSKAASIFSQALKGKDASKISDADLLKAVYDRKLSGVGSDFKSSSAGVQAGINKRIQSEYNDLVGINNLGNGQSATSIGKTATQEHPEIANLRAQGMPEDQIKTIANLTGLPMAKPTSSGKPTTTSNIPAAPKPAKSDTSGKTTPAQAGPTAISITNASPPSGYNVDAMKYSSGI